MVTSLISYLAYRSDNGGKITLNTARMITLSKVTSSRIEHATKEPKDKMRVVKLARGRFLKSSNLRTFQVEFEAKNDETTVSC